MKEFTRYWTFFCNPVKWEIDDFLNSNEKYDTFTVTDWQKDWFQKGQLGVIRVGVDRRTKEQLRGKSKLKPGIYAIVEVLSVATYRREPKPQYWLEKVEQTRERYRVDIKIIRNLINNPILLDEIKHAPIQFDKHLIEGFQASSMPLNPSTFEWISSNVGGSDSFNYHENNYEVNTLEKITNLEKEYASAVPEIQERISKHIERGNIAKEYKKIAQYKCQICEALGKREYVFKKKDGMYYIETHHVISVSSLQQGSLGLKNLLSVCPNHHRQLHYGNVKIQKNDTERFEFIIDEELVIVKKIV